jgi:hypothetical protein
MATELPHFRAGIRKDNGTPRVTLDLDLTAALALGRFLGALDSGTAAGFGLTGREYDALMDVLEYGDDAPFPLEPLGRSVIYKLLQMMPRVRFGD